MKTTIKIIVLLFITQLAFAQKKSIKSNQLFIVNTITSKSVKINTSVNTLRNFGTIISIDSLDQTIESTDYFIRHTFDNIVFYESVKGKISAFNTKSDEITLERKGMFSFSPGDHLDKIGAIFSDEVVNARTVYKTIEKRTYLIVNLQLAGFSEYQNKYIDNDYEGIALLFNPETKILVEIDYWIRP